MKPIFKSTMALLFLSGIYLSQAFAIAAQSSANDKIGSAETSLEVTTNADSKDSYTVTFSVLSGSGSINAYANESYISSGSLVEQGSDIFFEAFTDFGYILSAWYVNGTLVEDNVDNYFSYYNLQAELNVSVEFTEYEYPQIIPEYQFYGINNMQDVDFEIVWASETSIENIIMYVWDMETGQQIERLLIEGTDYQVVENTLTIRAEFMQSLNPEPFSEYRFMLQFPSTFSLWFGIQAIPNALPYLTPNVLTYDLSNPGDIFTNIVPIMADSISSILVNETQLTPNEEYTTNGGWLYFNNSYLSSQLQNPGDELGVTVVFNTMDAAQVSITTVQTGITNAVVSPNEFEFLEYGMPDYIDMQIAWNDATSVTGLVVSMNFGFGIEVSEWPAYTVTDNGDGTATLRLYLGGDKLAQLKERDENGGSSTLYVLVDVYFDLGASAPIFLTIVYQSYAVNAMVIPEFGGWVSGAYSYSPGEYVVLEAIPSWGYSFVQWETTEGEVLGTDPFYSFKMPANDVNLVARFQESINVCFEVNGNYFGKLYAYLDGAPLNCGDPVPSGSSVTFVAQPFPGYMVDFWMVNYEEIPDNQSNVFVLDNIQSSVNVSVTFTDVPANHHIVMFNVGGTGGSITATSGSETLFSGIALQNGSSVTFTAAPDQNMRVKRWKHNGVVVTGNISTNYTISSLNASAHITVEFESTTSINEPAKTNLVVYPNPCTDQLYFNSDKEIDRIQVVNVTGQTVLEIIKPSHNAIDLQNVAEGLYLVVFETRDNERIIERVVMTKK